MNQSRPRRRDQKDKDMEERELFGAHTADGNTTKIRGDRRPVVEAIVGENVLVMGMATAVTAVTQTAGPSATVEDETITVNATGRQVFEVGNGTALPGYLEVFGCEAACLTKIAASFDPRSTQGTGTARARRILRAICNDHPAFLGTVVTLPGNLALFGGDNFTPTVSVVHQ
jgi:hypothetical protein